MKNSILFLLVLSPLFSALAEPMPKCYEGNHELSVMNEAVIQYKQTLPNLKKVQVLVKATLVREMQPNFNEFGQHQHFIVALRDDKSDQAGLIEIAHSMNGYNFERVAQARSPDPS